jgi:hypothetical protein
MRKSWSVLILVAGVLIGYAVRPLPAGAQGEFQPFMLGETVRLTVEGFPGGPTITCKVGSVNNDFIQCAGEGQRRPRAVNLRYVQEITPLAER